MALVAFDFDGTLSATDMTALLAKEKDVAGEVRGLAEQGLRGEMPFGESLRQRVRLLAGLPDSRVDAAFEGIRMKEGAADLVAALRRADHHVALLTGSFRRGVEAVLDRERVGVDTVVANELVVDNGALTGEVTGPLVEDGKDEAFERIVANEGLSNEDTYAVGNGAVDLPMLKVAETAIGFDPVPLVEPHCDEVVHSLGRLRLFFDQHGMTA